MLCGVRQVIKVQFSYRAFVLVDKSVLRIPTQHIRQPLAPIKKQGRSHYQNIPMRE